MVFGIVYFLGKDEQLLLETLTDTIVHNGPGKVFPPIFCKRKIKRKAELLEPLDWCRIKDTVTGEVRVESGPQLLFLLPFDEVQSRGQAVSLTPVDFCTVTDNRRARSEWCAGPR